MKNEMTQKIFKYDLYFNIKCHYSDKFYVCVNIER